MMRRGFTLLETLVVAAVTATLLALMLPALSRARMQAAAAMCGSNLRQVVIANQMYAADHAGRSVPGAADHLHNLDRWHGSRNTTNAPFDGARGPLAAYLGIDRAVRACPSFAEFRTGLGAFERGSGGYGYNNAFVGVQLRRNGNDWIIETDRSGVLLDHVRSPQQTILFADAAFGATGLIEYSFVEPRFHPTTGQRADPSIHFRHAKRTNLAWGDGHVSAAKRTFTWSSGLYDANPERDLLGWPGKADDNRLFDLE